MEYLIGIDGGGTKTDCIITDDSFNHLFSVQGGPLNLLTNSLSGSSNTILQLVNTCLSKMNIPLAQLKYVGIGAAGAGRLEDSEKLAINLKSLLPPSITLKVISDAEAALEGAFNGKPGCILISGTGSIIYGKGKDGIVHRCGGFGRILGDEGSGYLLGKKGLIAVAKEFDGRASKTLLAHLLKEKYQIQSSQDLINIVYNKGLEIASIAPLILAAAGNNDEVALRIIDEETDELLSLISCIIKKLNQENLEICFTGKLISTINIFSITLRNKLTASYKLIKIKEPEYSPAMGAVFIANKK
jgi:N-acetylglucosamine kinase-like BadF-type ATPase